MRGEPWTRRNVIRLAAQLPTGAYRSQFDLLAAPIADQVKITGIHAMLLDHMAGNCLIHADTDSGISWIDEAAAR